jgi:tripartite-type tricarboxylate transporter receptor subunit TctC
VRAGNVRAYAVLSATRLDGLPNVTNIDEAGLPGLYVSSWQAIWAPKGTPRVMVRKLNRAVAAALKDPAATQRLGAIGQQMIPQDQLPPEALDRLQKAEIEKWRPIIKAANIEAR